MVFLKKIALALIKILILFMIITFEKVVGLPMISTVLIVVFFINESSITYRFFYLASASIFLALAYGFSFSLSLLLLSFLVLGIKYGGDIIVHHITRVLVLILSLVGLIALISDVALGTMVVSYFIISSVITMVILMKTLFSRQRSKFFR